ncbi:YwmB family TATA-box binding protein [Thermosyntropha sp.]|uniref:YwmB family TATA-box binding protein n=1 Tax=Thermosyntropha sp. TaxID=2740820 RepID=UPI0025CFF6CB|nr:YwmB family TATA-box binding protein [Thermosyntropha sp.]MBO8157985.1 YwmB family TATA-box binding protein [Thermosyntropha sp.]
MKKILLYLTVFTILCFFGSFTIDYTIGKQLTNRSPYYLAFTSIGANSLSSNLDAWAKIKTDSSPSELKAYMLKILAGFNISFTPENMKLVEDDKKNTIFYQYSDNKMKIVLVLESDLILEETFFVVSVNEKGDITDLRKWESRLNELIGIKWTYYYTYQGELDGIINFESQDELIKVILKNLDAKERNWFKNKKVTSCAAYSSKLKPYINSVQVGVNRCNLQIAITPDEKRNKTYIIIGAPLILGEY